MPSIDVAQRSSHAHETTAARTTEVTIREYRAEDHEAVVALFAAGMLLYSTAEHAAFWQTVVDESVADDLAHIDEVYAQRGGNFWVATIADDVVGMVGLEAKPGGEGELRRMSVKADARRFGVGRLLVTHLEQWASAHGYTQVWLSTGAVMTQARKFYLSIGYKHTHTEVYSHDPYYEAVFYAKGVAVAARS